MFAAAASAHAVPLRAASLIDPTAPLRTAEPLKRTHVWLVKTPCPDPLNVLAPMSRPRPVMVALPKAVVPLTCPEPLPR